MVTDPLIFAPLAALGGLLLYAAASDLRTRTIDNWVSVAMAAAAPVWWFATGLIATAMAWQFGYAALCFAVLFGLWMVRVVGGADVKLIGALALWLPPGERMTTFFVIGMTGAFVAIVAGVTATARRRATGAKRTRVEVPYAVAIAAGGAFFLLQATN